MNEEALFALALEKKNAAERQALLDQACAGNAQLRAAIEGLLKASADAGSFLEHPPLPLDATIVSSAANRNTSVAAEWTARLSFLKPCEKPDRIGKLVSKAGEYEIIEVVGHGGMGAVLRAFDTKLSRVVAVKVMAPELAANPVAVKRFLREATTAAAVHHDHVVTIHAVDDSHQPPYLVMQFVEGQTLQDKIDREGALELKHILRIGSQAAAGLAAAHKTGLIHRDVKPSNILLENGVERVKISDFGLARAADDVQMTQTGIISGTPQYMSPEQAKGEPIDIKSDLFSLGSVLYSMCTGRPAFRADNPIAVLRRVCDDTPRPIHETNPEIPEWLCEIVEKLMEKKPEQRFQSAQEVADHLAAHLAHLQQPASCPLPPRVTNRPSKSSTDANHVIANEARWFWAAGIMSVVAASLVLGAFNKLSTSLPPPLAIWFIGGGILSLPIGLLIMYAAWQVESRQSPDWAWTAALLSLLPINPFLIFCLPISIWSLATIRNVLQDGQFALQQPLKLSPPPSAWPPPTWLWSTGLFLAVAGMLVFFLRVAFSLHLPSVVATLIGFGFLWVTAVCCWSFAVIFQYVRFAGGSIALACLNGAGLTLAIVVMFFGFLKIALGYDTRPIAPIFVGLTLALVVAIAVWFVSALRAASPATRHKLMGVIPSKPTNRGVFIEHPVLGVLAILMLIVAASAATYMLTSASHRPDSNISPKSIYEMVIPGLSKVGPAQAQVVDLATWGKFIDPRNDCSFKRTSASVTITVPGDPPHSLGPDKNFDAPRLMEEIEGDFVIEVSVPPYERSKPGTSVRGDRVSYRMAGLLVWIDEYNLLRFELSSWGEQRAGAPFLHAGWVQSGRTAGDEGLILGAAAAPTHLRIARRGDELELSWGRDAGNCTPWKTVRNMKLPTRVSIGVEAGNCTNTALTAQFDRLAIAHYRPDAAGFVPLFNGRTGATAGLPSSAPPNPPLAIAPFDAQQAKAHQETWANHLGVPVEFTNSIGMKLGLIPPGTSDSHPSGLSQSSAPLFLGTTEVTVGQFRRFVDETSYQTSSEKNGLGGAKVRSKTRTEHKADYVWKHPDFAISNDHPVAVVTWHDAAAFCGWLSEKEGRTYRLPTSDEWNWAARAGSAARFYFGDAVSDMDAHAWHLGTAEDHTHPTGNKLPNAWGLFDIYGNVWELSYSFERGGKPFHPSQAKDGPQSAERINFWGGSFNNAPESVTINGYGPSTIGYSHTGFRVAIVGDLKRSVSGTATASSAPASEWLQLFNGNDLSGWKTHSNQPGNWKVENGELVGFGATSHLFSERDSYQDFHLRAEAKISDGGSSGVYFRAPEVAVGRYGEFPDGYEANINSTCKSDADRTGSLTGSLRGVAQYRETLHKPDEWFTLEIIARGPQIVIQVNGQTTVDFVDANNTFRRGHFALQVWPAQTVVRFRKILVRELPSVPN